MLSLVCFTGLELSVSSPSDVKERSDMDGVEVDGLPILWRVTIVNRVEKFYQEFMSCDEWEFIVIL